VFEEVGLNAHQEAFGPIVGRLDSISKYIFWLVKDNARPQPDGPWCRGCRAPTDIL